MKFKTIEIVNFMGIGYAKIALADRGLVLIQGANDYETSAISNGAGKSTVGDAISWVNYGTTARGESGDDIVNDEIGKDCSVVEEIEDGPETFKIARYRKHKKGKNGLTVHQLDAATGNWVDLTLGKDALTQVVVDKIIGCSMEVFNGAVYSGQEKMPDLPGMTDKTLKMLIEEASGATILETAYVEANKRLTTAKNAEVFADTHVKRALQQLDDVQLRAKDYASNVIEFDAKRKADILDIGAAAKIKKAHVETHIEAIAKMGDAVVISGRIAALNKQIADVASEVAEERTLTNSLQIATRKLDAARIAYTTAERALEKSIYAIEALDHQVGCPCSSCDRPFAAEDIAPAKKLAEARSAELKAVQVEAHKELEVVTEAHKSAADARDAFRATMTDLSKTNAARAANQAKLDQIRAAEAELVAQKRDLANMIVQIKAKRDEENPWVAEVTKMDLVVKDRVDQVNGFKEEHAQAITAVKVAEGIAKVFSPTGVRAFLLDDVTPFLNDQTAKYLGTLSDGHISATWTTLIKNAKGELREKFSIEVTSTTGGKKFGLVSGGEKRKVRIACALALQDLVARRATKPIELFIGDEIDDALDRAGQERLMTVLQEKASERGSVFIISHADLKDWIRNTITVRKTGMKATVEETTS